MVVAALGCLGLLVALFANVIMTWPFLICCVFFIVLGLALDFAPWQGETRDRKRNTYRRY